MNIILLGDVVGRPGREAVTRHLPALRRDLDIDVAVVNAENAAHGFGLTEKICGELYEAGADILTTGNHVWDQREIIPYIERDQRVLRPANFPPPATRRRSSPGPWPGPFASAFNCQRRFSCSGFCSTSGSVCCRG